MTENEIIHNPLSPTLSKMLNEMQISSLRLNKYIRSCTVAVAKDTLTEIRRTREMLDQIEILITL